MFERGNPYGKKDSKGHCIYDFCIAEGYGIFVLATVIIPPTYLILKRTYNKYVKTRIQINLAQSIDDVVESGFDYFSDPSEENYKKYERSVNTFIIGLALGNAIENQFDTHFADSFELTSNPKSSSGL